MMAGFTRNYQREYHQFAGRQVLFGFYHLHTVKKVCLTLCSKGEGVSLGCMRG